MALLVWLPDVIVCDVGVLEHVHVLELMRRWGETHEVR